MPITLDGSSLTVEKLVAIARDNEKVELAPEALERIKVCRLMLEEKLANKEIMYGTNTGIGEFSETMLNDEHHIMIGIILALAVQFIFEYLRRAHTGNCMPPRGIFIYFSDER